MKLLLIYFKKSGKYYMEAEYETNFKNMYEIFNHIKQLQKNIAPGLIGDAKSFYICVTPLGDTGYPGLILPVDSE